MINIIISFAIGGVVGFVICAMLIERIERGPVEGGK